MKVNIQVLSDNSSSSLAKRESFLHNFPNIQVSTWFPNDLDLNIQNCLDLITSYERLLQTTMWDNKQKGHYKLLLISVQKITIN